MRKLSRQVLILLMTIMPGLMFASDAYIKTEKSIGQGFLFEQKKKCYLATPEHVVEGTKEIQFMTADRKSHKAEIIKVFDVDLAILKVENPKACLYKQPDATTPLSTLLKVYRDGVLKSRLSDGSTLQTKVTIKGIDKAEYLQIIPRKKKDILKQGFSGSILYLADQPAGMLLEVDDENVGYVYRQDAISKKILSHFTPSSAKKIEGTKPKPIIRQNATVKGAIAKDKTIQHTFSWEENSPIILSIPKAKTDNHYQLFILDVEENEQYRGNFRGRYKFDFAFTPKATGTYTIKLVGTKGHGQYKIQTKQLALDSKLRSAGNVLEIGGNFTAAIALNSIVEYKFAGEENSPIILSIPKAKTDNHYQLFILDAEENEQYRGNFRGRYKFDFAFTPKATGTYTIKLVGTKAHGQVKVKIKQLALDSKLRSAGNVLEIGGNFTAAIALNSIVEYKFAGEENSPIILSIPKAKTDNHYQLFILDAEENEQYKGNFRGRYKFDFAFTPKATGTYTIKLVGTKAHGQVKVKIKQLALDSQLRGAGNVVDVGDSVKGAIALDSIAEYKYSGLSNSPIILSIPKAKTDNHYQLFILDSKGDEQYKGNFRGRYKFDFAFTPKTTGMYTIKLVGTKAHGKFKLKIKQLALDSQLRGAGNVVEAGDSLKGAIALRSIAEYQYSGKKNSSVKFVIPKAKTDFYYKLSILNSLKKEEYKGNFRGRYKYDFVFTPKKTEVYTIRLTGTKGHGQFNIRIMK